MEETSKSTSETFTEDGWKLAKNGIDLLLNNRIDEAEKLFKTNFENIQTAAGYSFLTFINALMSYEDEKVNIALNALKETERKCTPDVGWLKSMKNKVMGADYTDQSLADYLEQQIILADSQVCLAILTFLQQEFSGYVKGGWVLRKAWKIYQNVYHEILELYIQEFGPLTDDIEHPHLPKMYLNTTTTPCSPIVECENVTPVPSSPQSPISNNDGPFNVPTEIKPENGYILTNNLSNNYHKYSNNNNNNSLSSNMTRSASGTSFKFSKLTQSLSYPLGFLTDVLNPSTSSSTNSLIGKSQKDSLTANQISRLMAAVSFGYGVFQLSASLLPPTMLKLTQLFGFGANRKAGIDSLMFARKGDDMRSPLATLALLWYHTIVRPFFALDGYNLQAGVSAAAMLMNEAHETYSQSALFLFFEGRIKRLETNIPKALECYQLAVANSTQREIKLLCLHEVGWCYLIKLDYVNANNTFTLLKERSRWSRSFYVYLAILCAGSVNLLTEMTEINDLREILSNSVQKNSQLDLYLNRRLQIFPASEAVLQAQCNEVYWKLYIYELLYLWNALPSCSRESMETIIMDCGNVELREPMMGLSDLISGSCFSIMGNLDRAIECYRTCLSKRQSAEMGVENAHISAFASYELAVLLLKSENTRAEGKCLLQKSQNDFKDYDFEHRLNVRIHAALKNL